MDSRIILSTADFSANNIGRYVELSDLTKKVLAAQTQYGLDSEEAIALNTFLTQITDGGFIGGNSPLLRTLFIPALASQHSELLIDLARVDGSGNFVNDMDSTELDDATTNKNFCVYRKDNSDESTPIIGLSSFYPQSGTRVSPDANQAKINTNLFGEVTSNIAYPNFSIVAYMPYVNPNYSNKAVFENFSSGSHFLIGGSGVEFQRAGNMQYKSTLTFTDSSKLFTGFNGISYKKVGDTRTFEAIGDNISSVGAISGSSEYDTMLISNDSNKIQLSCMKVYNYNNVFSFFAGGEYLGTGAGSKLEELRGYVNTLMTALHVKN